MFFQINSYLFTQMDITFIKKTIYQKSDRGLEIKSGEALDVWNGIQKNLQQKGNILDIEGDFNIRCYIYGVKNKDHTLLLEIEPSLNFTNKIFIKNEYEKILLLYKCKNGKDKIIIRKFNLYYDTKLLTNFTSKKFNQEKEINLIQDEEINLVDKIYFINLPHRKDRFNHITQQLRKMRFKYISLIKGIYLPNKPQVGCALSHLSALKDAYVNKYKKIMVLEDDFTFKVSRNEFNKKVSNIYDKFGNWNVIQLSSINYKSNNTSINGINRVIKADTTSGYITNLKTIPIIFNIFKTCINPNPIFKGNQSAIDVAWQIIQPNLNWFIFNPQIGYQNEKFYSDIEKYRLNSWTI